MNQQINTNDLLAIINEQKALIAKLSAPSRGDGLSWKVSEKGAVSFYGMGRFPVTLYASQLEKLFAAQDDIKSFIAANADLLKRKEAKA